MRLRALLAAVALAGALGANAQEALEVIELRHRTVEEVLPVLRPLLEPGGALSGQRGQLFVRASPANVAELRRALATIDRRARRLEVSVRFDNVRESDRQSLEGRGTVRSGDVTVTNRRRAAERTGLELRTLERKSRADERVDQRVQVVEGGRAYIATGQSRPYPEREVIRTPSGTVVRETTVIHDTASGFYVVPRRAGERVQLDILVADGAATQISAPLGEWVEIGAAVESAARDSGGFGAAGRARTMQSRHIWVKVEESEIRGSGD